MPRYIDAEKVAMDLLCLTRLYDSDYQRGYYAGMDTALEAIKDAPAANVAEVKRGEWTPITAYATKAKYACSACGRTIVASRSYPHIKFPYCHCGANMKGE